METKYPHNFYIYLYLFFFCWCIYLYVSKCNIFWLIIDYFFIILELLISSKNGPAHDFLSWTAMHVVAVCLQVRPKHWLGATMEKTQLVVTQSTIGSRGSSMAIQPSWITWKKWSKSANWTYESDVHWPTLIVDVAYRSWSVVLIGWTKWLQQMRYGIFIRTGYVKEAAQTWS